MFPGTFRLDPIISCRTSYFHNVASLRFGNTLQLIELLQYFQELHGDLQWYILYNALRKFLMISHAENYTNTEPV